MDGTVNLVCSATQDSRPPDKSLSLLTQLVPPPPYRVRVRNLSVQAPMPRWVVPLAIPFAVPRWVQRRLQKGDGAGPTALVRGVSLEIAAGQVLAIVGGSGSGKTTFLNVLAGRVGNLELPVGEIEYIPLGAASTSCSQSRAGFSAAQPPTASSLSAAKKAIGYVRQDDALLPYLTVRETLETAAALRLPESVSHSQRSAIVVQTMAELGLRDVADVVVGGALRRGISGGERRRLSIGCTLVTLPSILLLDEPTSGLDSSTAFQILQTLQGLAANGRVVVLSCHLPRSEAFSIVDKILLLSRGSPVFSGERGKILAYFASLGYPVPTHTNPLDFAIDISSLDSRTAEAEAASKARVDKLVTAWKEFELARASQGALEEEDTLKSLTLAATDLEKAGSASASRKSSGEPRAPPQRRKRANTLQQTYILTRRGLRNVVRNWGVCVGFALQAIVIGVLLGLVFFDPPETPAGIASLKTLAYVNDTAFYYLSIILAIFLLCGELVVFDREREDNLYSSVPWVLSVILSYGPINVICATTYCVIIYFMGGFWRQHLAKNVLSFIAHGILQQQAAWSYALLACSIQRSFAQASLLANGVSIVFFLSAGYLITDLPPWVEWTKWLSPFFYGFQWIARLQFVSRKFACDGVTGPALNQCEGVNVLRGMRFNLNTPLYVFPLGLLGFVVVTYALATLILATYHPGGVKHAAKQVSKQASDPTSAAELKRSNSRGTVDIVVRHLQLVVVKLGLGKLRERREKVILEDVSAHFPAARVSAIMGPSGVRLSLGLYSITD
ncbi:hypothetical protein JCM3770_002793 [Rhodotorula araucariae]